MTFTASSQSSVFGRGVSASADGYGHVGPRPGFSWPTVADGGAWLQSPNSATAYAMRSWGPRNTQNTGSTGVPDTTNSHLAIGGAYIVSGATPSGSFGVTLASETAGTSVTVKAGSFLMYRTIP